ncbi:hypothetical protein D3C81_1479650 [compost metagenome]
MCDRIIHRRAFTNNVLDPVRQVIPRANRCDAHLQRRLFAGLLMSNQQRSPVRWWPEHRSLAHITVTGFDRCNGAEVDRHQNTENRQPLTKRRVGGAVPGKGRCIGEFVTHGIARIRLEHCRYLDGRSPCRH